MGWTIIFFKNTTEFQVVLRMNLIFISSQPLLASLHICLQIEHKYGVSCYYSEENEDDFINIKEETGIARQEKLKLKPSSCYTYC